MPKSLQPAAFKKLHSIKIRMLLIAAISAFGILAVGGIAIYGTSTVARSVSDAATFELRATTVRDFRTDIAMLRGMGTELFGARTSPLMAAFDDKMKGAMVDLAQLRAEAQAGDIGDQVTALEQLLSDVRTQFGPLSDAYRTIGDSQNTGLNQKVQDAAGRIEAPVKTMVLSGGGEDALRLAFAIATLRLSEKAYMANHDQQALGEIDSGVVRVGRSLGRVSDVDPDAKTAITTAIADYNTAIQQWIDVDKQAFTLYDKVLGDFDKMDPFLKGLRSKLPTAPAMQTRASMQPNRLRKTHCWSSSACCCSLEFWPAS